MRLVDVRMGADLEFFDVTRVTSPWKYHKLKDQRKVKQGSPNDTILSSGRLNMEHSGLYVPLNKPMVRSTSSFRVDSK